MTAGKWIDNGRAETFLFGIFVVLYNRASIVKMPLWGDPMGYLRTRGILAEYKCHGMMQTRIYLAAEGCILTFHMCRPLSTRLL